MAGQTRRRQASQVAGDADAARRGASDVGGPPTVAVDMPAFVGREDVLATVSGALDRGPSLVLVEGEAGIGKTRLVREVLALRQHSTILVAACPPLREPFPLGPVVNGVRHLCDRVDGLGLSPLAGALRPLFPEWVDQLPPALEPLEEPTEVRHRIFRALTELVRHLGVEVLVAEDAHWADTATLEWLLTLTTAEPAAGHPRMSVVVTFRPSDVPEGSALMRLTSRPPTVMGQVRVGLEPLGVAATQQLVASMIGAEEVSEKFAVFLHERTDGVPLAVEETVRLLRERHEIARRGGEWVRKVLDELEVPPTLRDSVLERVGRLTPEARAVLRAAAILAEPADEALLGTVADLDEPTGLRGVAAGLAAGLLRQAGRGRLVFRHVLDAKAVEESIPISQRWQLHAKAARALEKVEPQPIARLARHFWEANDAEAWCRYAEAAADAARESGDNRSAVMMLLDVLARIEHPIARRIQVTRKLGEAAFFGVDPLGDFAEHVVRVLRELLTNHDLSREDRGEFRLLLGRLLFDAFGDQAAFEEFEAAVPDLEHSPELAIQAMSNLALPYVSDWPAKRHLDWLDRATELVARIDAPSSQLANRAAVLLYLGEEAGWKAMAEITVPRRGLSDQRRAAVGLLNAAEAALVWGRYEAARAQLDSALRVIEDTGYRTLAVSAQLVGAYVDWYTGRWEALRGALTELSEAAELLPRFRIQVTQLLGVLDVAAGERTSAQRRLRQVMNVYERRGVADPQDIVAPAALSRLLLHEGNADEALQVTSPVMEMIARKGVWLWATDVAPVHVEALIHAGQVPDAAAVVARFAAGVDGRHAPGPAASLLVCQGLLAAREGHPANAAAQFSEAASAWAALPRPYDELLTLERRGRCLLTSGQQDEALSMLTGVEQRLRDLGAKWDADRVAHLLRQHGVEVVRTWRRGRRGYGDQLSPRELEVVELVARGLTNKQVAERLFISPQTVSRHLSKAMRKLAVSSRTAVAMAASDAGLLQVPTGE